MSLRSKTKRRLLILITLCLVVGLGLFWVLRRPSVRNAAQTAELRESGMADYGRGDYLAAMPKLSQYLSEVKINQKDPSDQELEALYAFGDCRRRIPTPRQQHLHEADQAFERYLSYRPNDAAAQQTHLKVISKTQQFAATQTLAERILARDPNDIEALFVRAYAMYRQPKPNLDLVEQAVGDLLKVDSGHVNGLMLSQQVQLQKGASPKQLIERIEPLAVANEKDPRFKLVAAETFHMLALSDAAKNDPNARAEWDKQCRNWLLKVVEQPPTDAEFATIVAASLDRALLVPRTLRYLMTAVDAVKPNDEYRDRLQEALVRRLWQSNVYSEVIKRTADLNPANNNTDADLLAYRAMTLQAMAAMPSAGDDRTRLLNDADAILRALRDRTASHEAQAWAILLKLDTGERKPAAEVIQRCIEAREKNPDNAVVTVRLGDAYAEQGENESAVQMWAWAARLNPDWGYPYARVAMARLEEGRMAEAERLADRAHLLSPSNRQFMALLAQIRYQSLPKTPAPSALEAQLRDIEKVQSAYPNDPGTLPLQVTLLARVRGTEPARKRLAEALALVPPLPVETLLQLQSANDTHGLGMDDQIAAVIGARDNAALPVATRKASLLLAEGKGQEGLQALQEARRAANADKDLRWMLAIATYLDRAKDDGAAAAWTELLNQTSTDLYYQTQFLRSPTRFSQRDLWTTTIDRVRAITGNDGSLWKLERARWVLAGPDNEKERGEAIALLSELTQKYRDSAEARRLLGLALIRDQKFARAAEELSGALQMSPTRGDIALELISALRMSGDLAAARARMQEIGTIPSLTTEQRLRLANDYQELGLPEQAIKTLLAAPEGGERDARLGRLYRAGGRLDEAKAAYKRVLNDVAATPANIYAGADFFASVGDKEQTQFFLDRLQTMPQSKATTEMLLGQFKETYGAADEAMKHLRSATAMEPANPLTWKALAGYSLRSRRYDEAVAAVDSGLAAAPTDQQLLAMKPLIATVRKLIDVEPVRLLVDYLSREPANAAALATLNVFAEGQAAVDAATPEKRRDVAIQTMEKLAALADVHRDFWTLQERVILYYLTENKPQKAAELAERATALTPALPDPPRFAAEAYMQMGRWTKAIEAATIWRQRASADPMPADLMLARAMIANRQSAGATRTLEQHIKANPLPGDATGDKPPSVSLLTLYQSYGEALIDQGRVAEAAQHLAPLLSLGQKGRAVWLSLADTFTREDAARDWIDQVVATWDSKPAAADRLRAADACLAAARATRSSSLLVRGTALIEPLVALPEPQPEALRLAALIAHFQADYARAEQLWRKLLKDKPTADVRNNLAYVLLLSGKADVVDEAHELANQAVAAEGENPLFLGTLGRSFARQGKRAEAMQMFRKALTLDAESMEAMVGLAEELAKGSPDERAEAQKLLSSARLLMSQHPEQVDPDVQRQADSVQAAIDPSPSR